MDPAEPSESLQIKLYPIFLKQKHPLLPKNGAANTQPKDIKCERLQELC